MNINSNNMSSISNLAQGMPNVDVTGGIGRKAHEGLENAEKGVEDMAKGAVKTVNLPKTNTPLDTGGDMAKGGVQAAMSMKDNFEAQLSPEQKIELKTATVELAATGAVFVGTSSVIGPVGGALVAGNVLSGASLYFVVASAIMKRENPVQAVMNKIKNIVGLGQALGGAVGGAGGKGGASKAGDLMTSTVANKQGGNLMGAPGGLDPGGQARANNIAGDLIMASTPKQSAPKPPGDTPPPPRKEAWGA